MALRIARHFSRTALGRRVGVALASGYVRLVGPSMRWRREGWEELLEAKEACILAFWHGRLLMMAPHAARLPFPATAMISLSRDGGFIAEVAARFGISAARGGSRDPGNPTRDRGGGTALLALKEALERGDFAALTPDGPRGPARRAQTGASLLSALTDKPIRVAAWSCRPGLRLPNWDGFLLPLPFARASLVVSRPLAPPADQTPAALEAHRRALEALLDETTDHADRLIGRALEPRGAS